MKLEGLGVCFSLAITVEWRGIEVVTPGNEVLGSRIASQIWSSGKSRAILRAGLALGLVGLAFAAATQVVARLCWCLPESGRIPEGALAPGATSSWQSDSEKAVHRVAEWPPERGRAFAQAPMLDALTASRALPPVAQRLPEDPLVIVPPEQCGPYGGVWRRLATSPVDVGNIPGRVCYEGLIRFGPRGDEVLPNLAVRWSIEEEGRAFTFWLRKGVRWSDGAPFSADDILFWYEDVLLDRDITPTVPAHFIRGGEIMKVEKVDDFTVRFRFREPYGLFPWLLAARYSDAMVAYPAHYLRQFHPKYTPLESLEAMAKKEKFDLWFQLFADRREWTNPELPRLTAWVMKNPPPATPVLWERNPYYWKVDPDGNQLPYIDGISLDICDAETINLKALNGELGMQGRHLAFNNYPLFMENQARGGYRVLRWTDGGDAMNVLCLNLNHKDPEMRAIMQDRRFRIALSLAVNRQELNTACYFGLGQPRQVCPSPASPYYSAAYEHAYTEYDPQQASRLLDEMGLDKRDARGFRLRPNGKPLRLTIETSSAMLYPQLIQLVAEYWTAAGVETEMRLLARELVIRRVEAGMHDVTVWTGAGEFLPIIDPRYFFPHNIGSYYALDFVRWYESRGKMGERPLPDMMRCIDLYGRIEATADEQERIRLFQEIIEINRENLWVIGLVGELPAIHVVKNTFRNVPESAVFTFSFRSPGNTATECYAIEEP